jgi:hypothetical protein
MPKPKISSGEMVRMTVVSVLMPSILLIVALVWVAFYSMGYSLFQKIVIAVIALIVIGAAEAILWMVWAGKKGMMPPMRYKQW